METKNHKIYAPNPGDNAKAMTQMNIMASSVENALNNVAAQVSDSSAKDRADSVARDKSLSDVDAALAVKDAELDAKITSLAGSVVDTGWRALPLDSSVASLVDSSVANTTNRQRSFVEIRRVGQMVAVRGYVKLTSQPAGAQKIVTVPTGFRARQIQDSAFNAVSSPTNSYGTVFRSGAVQYTPWTSSVHVNNQTAVEWIDGFGFYLVWQADDAFPDLANLPGDLVTDPYSPLAGGTPDSLAAVRSQLTQEVTRSSNVDTVLGDRATALEARASSIEGTLASTPAFFKGSGFPEGKVVAPVNAVYVDSATTAGVSHWVKKIGTGSTGWEVLVGDSGWRSFTVPFSSDPIFFRRINNRVHVSIGSGQYRIFKFSSLSNMTFGFNLFTPPQSVFVPVRLDGDKSPAGVLSIEPASSSLIIPKLFSALNTGTVYQSDETSYLVSRPWDPVLPGSPA